DLGFFADGLPRSSAWSSRLCRPCVFMMSPGSFPYGQRQCRQSARVERRPVDLQKSESKEFGNELNGSAGHVARRHIPSRGELRGQGAQRPITVELPQQARSELSERNPDRDPTDRFQVLAFDHVRSATANAGPVNAMAGVRP